jgi:hypothetical protein
MGPMKYRLPRQIFSEPIVKIILREIKRQKLEILKPTKRELEELSLVCKAIIEKGLPDYLVCKKLPNNLGSGIFLHPQAKPLLKDQIIGSYSGKVLLSPQNAPGDSSYAFALIVDILLTKEEQAFLQEKSYRPNRLYSLDVDAEHEGNFIRFINHSEKPNVVSHLFKIPKNPFGLTQTPVEVIYVAKKTIHPGEQLLVSYEGDGNTYWNHLNIKPIPITPKTFILNPDLTVHQKSKF